MLYFNKKRYKYLIDYLSYNLFCERWRTFVAIDGSKPVCIPIGNHPWHRDFCADCFLFVKDDDLYVFYETVNKKGKGLLGAFKFENGIWQQLGPVHDPEWHTSYPQVFEEAGHIYMIPEQSDHGRGDVSLYEATDFPFGWKKVKTLIDRPLADSTLLRKDGHYYLACYTIPPHETAELWHAPSLLGPWERHPQWQNIHQDAKYRRCGGAFLVEHSTLNTQRSALYRVAQDCDGGYGIRLYKVPILKLSPTEYEEGVPELLMDKSDYPSEVGRHTYNSVVWRGKNVVCYDTKTNVLRPFEEIVSFIRGVVKRRVGL